MASWSLLSRLPYMYGVYKPAKKAFCWIAGTAKENGEAAIQRQKNNDRRTAEKLRASLYAPASLGVQLLKVVMETLRDIRQQRMQQEGLRTCWSVELLEEVAQYLRRLPAKTIENEMRTVDLFNHIHDVTA